jgi:hypothetical protein
LKSGGRFVVSDIVVSKPLPDWILDSVRAYTGCISGAILKEDYLKTIEQAGFHNVQVLECKNFSIEYMQNDDTALALIEKSDATVDELNQALRSVESITVVGYKP